MYLWILVFVLLKSSLSNSNDKEGNYFCYKFVAGDFQNPLVLTHDYINEHYFYVAEHIGEIHKIDISTSPPEQRLFLDIKNQILLTDIQRDERGLLGFAFHPDFKRNGYFYIYYSRNSSDRNYDHVSTVSRFKMMSAEDAFDAKVDMQSEQKILEIYQPEKRQNGGQVFFGSEGYLYITVGDGGDKQNKRFTTNSYLGKILRIDVNVPDNHPYAIPSSNPFVNESHENAIPEIFAYGFRNPWRCSVDRGGPNQEGRGRIFCGDAGEERNVEELNIIDKGGQYGWMDLPSAPCRRLEQCLNNIEIPLPPGYKLPIYDYSLENGQAVIGGYVYRGLDKPSLQGLYFYADYIKGTIHYLQENFSTGQWSSRDLLIAEDKVCQSQGYMGKKDHFVLAFGENLKGEIFILTKDSNLENKNNGIIYQIVTSDKGVTSGSWKRILHFSHFVSFVHYFILCIFL